MLATVNLYSEKKGELNRFLSNFYNTSLNIKNSLSWEIKYNNPVEIAEIIGVYRDNSDNYEFAMWICLDKNIFIRVTENNTDTIIRYLFQRFPY